MNRRFLLAGWIFFALLGAFPYNLFAQPGATVNLSKPKKYMNRVLPSEKAKDKPMNPWQRAFNNIPTHYNFHFNGELKLQEVLENAVSGFRDDYSKLLPFYNFTMENTAAQATELDSVIWKGNDAILLHDLRSDWVDDMYMLMGKSYYYKKDFDSAAICFQYINYAFQPRTKDEYGMNKAIGSNLNNSGNVYTVSTKEKASLTRMVTHTPARNEAMLWLAKTLTMAGDYSNAASLIETFKRDVTFPERLYPHLKELQAFWFYQQEMYDSTAVYLIQALDNAPGLRERARWEFLIAQILSARGNVKEADEWYGKAILHTTNPILEAYARINQIRLLSGEESKKRIDADIAKLVRMANGYKFEEYRHMIFYAAAEMELERDGVDNAIELLRQSSIYSNNDPDFKTKALILMADLAYDRGKYEIAALGYDSVNVNDPQIKNPEQVNIRKTVLKDIISNINTIRATDSLIQIAQLTEEQRSALIKAMLKKIRKDKNLEEEAKNNAQNAGYSPQNRQQDVNAPTDLFNENNSKGDWYFYNPAAKAQGIKQFQTIWGNRPNADNWRRSKALPNFVKSGQSQKSGNENTDEENAQEEEKEITAETLLANVPLTPEAMEEANKKIENAYYNLSKLFREKTGDCNALIKNNEDYAKRFSGKEHEEEILFGLIYCLKEMGFLDKSEYYRLYLERHHAQGKFTKMVNDPAGAMREQNQKKVEATRQYEDVYRQFIEGNFEKAVALKAAADKTYGENYWTPQLLYIEAVYYAKSRNDSAAINSLEALLKKDQKSPMAEKAKILIEAIQNRTALEQRLAAANIVRMEDEKFETIDENWKLKSKEQIDTTRKIKAVEAPKTEVVKITSKIDSTVFKPQIIEKKTEIYTFIPTQSHIVVLLLDKVDVVFVNEAKNAIGRFNRSISPSSSVSLVSLDDNRKFIIISPFQNFVEASSYRDNAAARASQEIFPWMPKDKYSFFVISPENLETLKTRKDVNEYLNLLKQNLN